VGKSRGKERILRGEENEVCCIYAYEDRIMKPTKHFEKGRVGEWEYNGEGEPVQSTLYTCMELSQ
jgi:hypothetical protein